MFCRNAFCKFGTLLALAWEGIPVACVFVLAMSARAFRIFDVSAAAPVPAFALGSFSEMKSLGGVPVGVVDSGSTESEVYQKPAFSLQQIFPRLNSSSIRLGILTIRSRSSQPLLETGKHCTGEGISTLPNIKKLQNFILIAEAYVS